MTAKGGGFPASIASPSPAGQDAHFAYSASTHTLYGLPEGGADAPMIMHNTDTNTSVCDDSIKTDSWGLTILNEPNGEGGRGNQTTPSTTTDTFVAFSYAASGVLKSAT